jgi:phospholipid/cholesterol/gamma-HCH transport system substrate-binding protein
MKTFRERNQVVVGLVGVAVVGAAVLGATNYDKLPFFSSGTGYSAYFTEAGGLTSGAAVQVSGYRVGQVSSVTLDGARVLIKFDVDDNIRLGDRTEAAIKTKSLLGAKILEITPRGDGTQSGAIPTDRTTPPYQLPDALGDLSATISGLNTNQVSDSLAVLADTFKDTPPDLKLAVQGVARFSETLDQRDAQLRTLLASARASTDVLAQRSDKIVSLIADTDALLVQLHSQSNALDQISGNISAVAQQVKELIAENRGSLKPALNKLNGVLTIIDARKAKVQESIKGVNHYALSLGESVSSGPFFKAYVANLLPGQFVQPFVDAAFSDLGLDPNVLPPSQLTDPPVGQPGTPAMPLPYPRTGQGGDPNQFLPDAITGKPGDPRYPYREPLPAPPPGGPPPGPPAPAPPGLGSDQTPGGPVSGDSSNQVSTPPPNAGATPGPAAPTTPEPGQ